MLASALSASRAAIYRSLFVAMFFCVSLQSLAYAQDPIPAKIVKGSLRIELEQVASDLVAAHYLTHANDNSGRLFIVDQAGDIALIKNGVQQSTPYFSVSNLLTPLGFFGSLDPFTDYDERGLLGLAFHPDFAKQGADGFGKFYTHTSESVSGSADFTVSLPAGVSANHQAVIREWTVDPTLDSISASTTGREVMRVDQPQFNHNGGALVFGPDKQLYIGFGDGGAAKDVGDGHGLFGNGQNLDTIHGSIARIDPLGNNSANGNYGIPSDNPFVGLAGLDEIYASGLRNPFQFGFDVDPFSGLPSVNTSGKLIVADVGQSNIEEVNFVELGDNLGWRYKEGTFYYDSDLNTVSDTPIPGITLPDGFAPVDPVLQYDHDEGISIIGGFVYRGTELPELEGKYIFADFSQDFMTPSGRLFAGDLATGEIEELVLGLGDRELGMFVKGIGRGPDGELYLLAGTNLGPFRDANGNGFGGAYKLVSAVPEPTAFALLGGLSAVILLRRRRASLNSAS